MLFRSVLRAGPACQYPVLIFFQEVPVFKDGKMFERELPKYGIPTGKVLDSNEIATPIGLVLNGGLLWTIIFGVFQVCSYLAMFSIIPVMMRSSWAARGFWGVFSFYCFVAVPAVLAAAVYSAAGLPGLDFGTVFVFTFFVYILMMMWLAQRASGPTESAEDEDDV